MPPVFSKELDSRRVTPPSLRRQNRTSPCEAACPAGNPIQKVHACLEKGRSGEALAWLISRNPFPGVTGRTCPHPCEDVCNRLHHDEAVSIRALERLAADKGGRGGLFPASAPATGKNIGIVGAGPAGLACAWFAVLLGHAATVYEAAPVAGGIPRLGVPDFRLPKDVVDAEVGAILDRGVRVHTNVRVGRDISLAALRARHDACVVAAGARRERVLDIPGREFLLPALDFLTGTHLRRSLLAGRSVLVLGGGGVALDCAFSALRLGASRAALLSLEADTQLHAPAQEIEQARREGIALLGKRLAVSVRRTDRGCAVASREVKAFSFAENGALRVEAGKEFPELEADLVICASGLQPDLDFAKIPGLEWTARGFLKTGEFGNTSVPGLFAAGDASSGPSLIAAAIGSGRRAALGAHRFLCGAAAVPDVEIGPDNQVRVVPASEPALRRESPHVVEYEEICNVDARERLPRRSTRTGFGARPVCEAEPETQGAAVDRLPFAEWDAGLSEEDGGPESERCLHCGHCNLCGSCVEACPGHILEMSEDGPVVAYPDECWHCGCCRLACTAGAVSYKFPLNMLV